MESQGAVFEIVLAGHVLCAVVGFGSILVTGGYAGAARPHPGGHVPDSVRRYFRPGPNRASRVIFAVPVLGVVLAALHGGGDFREPWLWVGSGLWLLAAGLAAGVIWPAEARIAALVGTGAGGPEQSSGLARSSGGAGSSLVSASRRAAGAAAVVDVAVVAAIVVMIARPGG